MTVLMLSCLVFGGALVTRAAILQLGTDTRLDQMARRQFQSRLLLRPRRGVITDRNGEPLATNAESYSLAANPTKVGSPRNLARLLSKALDLPYSKVLQRMEGKKEFAWVKRHLSEHEMGKLKKWKIIGASGDLADGLWLVRENRRVYPHGELAGHVLGGVNVDLEGLEGSELWLDERLRGKVVSVSAIRDALGRPAFIDAASARGLREAQDGEAVALTIDASLQFAVEEELRSAIRKSGAKAGSVIVMNALSGEILALANQPSFDPNQKGASSERRRNRVFTDGYEPGSTLKPILLAGALSSGSKLSDRIHGENGQIEIQGKKISEAEAHEKFKWISLKQLIQVSSNVGAAKLALKLGADRFLGTLTSFGFGEKTRAGFPGEIAGKLPPRKAWTPLTLANIGFGQGLLVTPMQMIRAYAALLNGGWLVQPLLIKDPDRSFVSEAPRRILSPKVAEQVVNAMEAVTLEGGTGTKAALEGYRVAGKTGTAQKVDPATGGYSRSKYIASFIGFAIGVDPKIVIFASIDEPQGIYYASETAAPLFKEVLAAVAGRFSLPSQGVPLAESSPLPKPTRVNPVRQASIPAEPTQIDQVVLSQAHPDPEKSRNFSWKMPSLHGLTPREAIQLLAGRGYSLEIRGMGVVVSQVPEAGKTMADGDSVRLTLSEQE